MTISQRILLYVNYTSENLTFTKSSHVLLNTKINKFSKFNVKPASLAIEPNQNTHPNASWPPRETRVRGKAK